MPCASQLSNTQVRPDQTPTHCLPDRATMFELSARSVIWPLGRILNQATSLALRPILIGRVIMNGALI
jgi:hypothetical protein